MVAATTTCTLVEDALAGKPKSPKTRRPDQRATPTEPVTLREPSYYQTRELTLGKNGTFEIEVIAPRLGNHGGMILLRCSGHEFSFSNPKTTSQLRPDLYLNQSNMLFVSINDEEVRPIKTDDDARVFRFQGAVKGAKKGDTIKFWISTLREASQW